MSHPSAVLELNGPQVLRVMKRPQVPLVQEAVRVVTTQLGSQGRFCLPYPEFAMRETGRVSWGGALRDDPNDNFPEIWKLLLPCSNDKAFEK